jgi:hypothetical protein
MVLIGKVMIKRKVDDNYLRGFAIVFLKAKYSEEIREGSI